LIMRLLAVSTNELTELTGPSERIPTYERPVRKVLGRFTRLNSSVSPGLSEAEFRGLFAKCRCGLITTRRVFKAHNCAPVNPIIIDLTLDDDNEPTDGPIVIDLTG